MKFIIVGEKVKGVVGLFDEANGGVALATAYTVKQLIDLGHEVIGVDSIKPFKYTICTRKGEPSKRTENLDSLETKKSATSFIKGIKPSRKEKAENKAKAKKRVATMKQAKADAKKKAEVFKKFLIPFKSSKLLMLETEYELRSSEYHDEGCTSTYRFLIKSPSAMTTFRKIIKDNIPWGLVKDDMQEIMKGFKRYSRVTVEVTFNGLPSIFEKNVLKGISSSYRLEFNNYYEDFGGQVKLRRNKSYRVSSLNDITYNVASSSFHHSDLESFRIGATATDSEDLADFINGLSRRRVIVDENNNIMDINRCDYHIGGCYF